MFRTLTATRYLVPLREGGSLPAIVEAEDGELYVLKFVGAGQGPKALIAELVAGEIGRALGLNVPELILMEVDAALGKNERHPEIRELLLGSVGLNLGLRYLPSAFAYDPLLRPSLAADLASAVVWFDAFITNVDRTVRNANLLLWQNDLWLIDHGAALYFHHDWGDYLARSQTPFTHIKQHILIGLASQMQEADAQLRPRLNKAIFTDIVAQIPAIWLDEERAFANQDEHRAAYVAYLTSRLAASATFVEEARRAHAQHV